jgi:hypothetical protein
VTRQRLRPAHTPEELARIYAVPHNHAQWSDHILRVDTTVKFGTEVFGALSLGADLSCGSGAILRGLPVARRIFGDFAPGYQYTGPLEETLEQIPDVDLYVCCETLEHVDDPDAVLKQIRAKSAALLLSTPIDAWDDTNEEHYFAWSSADLVEMLAATGWDLVDYMELDFRALSPSHYNFAIVAAR